MTRTIVSTGKRLFAIAACFALAFTLGTVASSHQPAGTPWIGAQASSVMHAAVQLKPGATLSAYVTGTITQDAAACSTVYHYHHVNAVPALYEDEALWQSAYRAAMDAAWKAGPELSGVIVHYLREGDQWSWVRAACAAVDRATS